MRAIVWIWNVNGDFLEIESLKVCAISLCSSQLVLLFVSTFDFFLCFCPVSRLGWLHPTDLFRSFPFPVTSHVYIHVNVSVSTRASLIPFSPLSPPVVAKSSTSQSSSQHAPTRKLKVRAHFYSKTPDTLAQFFVFLRQRNHSFEVPHEIVTFRQFLIDLSIFVTPGRFLVICLFFGIFIWLAVADWILGASIIFFCFHIFWLN